MNQAPNSKLYDLEERTLRFAKRVRDYVNKLPKTITNIEYGTQLARAFGSVGANYIEANEALGKKDFQHLTEPMKQEENEKEALIQEASEFIKIFTAIVRKVV